MKISIVTVTLNEAPRLLGALQSVADQNYHDLEHIVVDGFSTDATPRLAEAFPNVKLIQRKPAGVYDALNEGFAVATGDIFGLVHGNDSMPSSDVLHRVAKEFADDPTLDFVYGDLRYVHPVSHRYARTYYAGRFKPGQLRGGMAPPHPTLFIRREAFRRVGNYRLDLTNAADFEMWIRLFNDKSLHYKYIPAVLAEMSTGGRSATWKARLMLNNREKLRALRLNNIRTSPLRLVQKYLIVIRDLLFGPRYEI